MAWIDWILASQNATGFFGPTSNRDWWPRMIVVKVLEQYADATQDTRIVPFLQAYFEYQLRELPGTPLESWARARGADNALGVWWLIDRTGDEGLLPLVDLLIEQTSDWDASLGSRLITGPAQVFNHATHGPNVAMGLKTGAVAGLRDSHDAGERRAATERSFANLDRWHGQAHGFFSGDEWLGGRTPTAGVETCQVVELMYTLERLSQIHGSGVYGDRLESLAFNLLAASSDPRMLAHQYHQQANQVRVSVARRPWTHSSDDANIFGLEPHFGCCTANLHQGWPKLVRSSWVADLDGGLRVVAYVPGTVEARIGEAEVRLEVETDYPFDETISIRVRSTSGRAATGVIRLRIPEWAGDATLAIGDEDVALEPADGYVDLDRRWTDGDHLVLTLPMTPRIERREGQSAVVRFGPLTMALRIAENWIEVGGAPGLGEWEVLPRSSWNFGLVDVDDTSDWVVERRTPGPVPFALDASPVTLTTRGAHVNGWELEGAQAGPVPFGPVRDVGPVMQITLVPYGSARLRITEFPVALGGLTDDNAN